jgi:RNA polymerase sigma factor (sigma-70 family)
MAIDVERLFRSHSDQLIVVVQARFSRVPRWTVEEACAEAWLIAWRYRDAVDDANAFGWLYVVARNVLLELVRRHASQQPLDELPEAVACATSNDPELVVEAREALRALAALRPNQRRALALQIAGFSYEEIRAIEAVTLTWVNRHVTEGRRAVRLAA